MNDQTINFKNHHIPNIPVALESHFHWKKWFGGGKKQPHRTVLFRVDFESGRFLTGQYCARSVFGTGQFWFGSVLSQVNFGMLKIPVRV